MKIPKYVTDYVASLHESEARHQLARMIIKSHKQQRINDDMAHVEVSDVEWSARTPERCEVCSVVCHSYSTVTIRSLNEKRIEFYCQKCHKERWGWL